MASDLEKSSLISGSADRAAGDEEDCARAADGAHLSGGVPGDGVPGRLRLHVGPARKEAAAARQPSEWDTRWSIWSDGWVGLTMLCDIT